ncbi:MAG TPA: ATP-grasp domain-containing protein [Gemmatimonadaceae bacterium]
MESQLAAAGVPCLPWRYYADEDLVLLREAAETGPLVLRSNRSDGGAGLSLIHDPSQLRDSWPAHRDGFLAAAPFLAPNLPLNVNACVFPGGEVSMHPASVQLIGIEGCTGRRFGYCGNDFTAVAALSDKQMDELETLVRQVGQWLAAEGYLGAFGIDAMLYGEEILFIELNPRFQGSSAMAAAIVRELDRPDLFLDHLSAFLGLPPPKSIQLRELARLRPAAHVVCHNVSKKIGHSRPANLDQLPAHCSLLADSKVRIAREAIRADLSFAQAVTANGFTLLPPVRQAVVATLDMLFS